MTTNKYTFKAFCNAKDLDDLPIMPPDEEEDDEYGYNWWFGQMNELMSLASLTYSDLRSCK